MEHERKALDLLRNVEVIIKIFVARERLVLLTCALRDTARVRLQLKRQVDSFLFSRNRPFYSCVLLTCNLFCL